LIRRFKELQSERVGTYAFFEKGFQDYLSSYPNYDFQTYRQMAHETTETFKKISNEIIDIKIKLNKTPNCQIISQIIAKVQDHEQEKLNLVPLFFLDFFFI
ncbi:hypothetical protein HELRODRAFT_91026, partial [Helobdella robusta]|uniref:Uncharacterized protein n=1 Tax=Helobdella robusta TaxID=6412 RepID=T1G7Y8_HELRO